MACNKSRRPLTENGARRENASILKDKAHYWRLSGRECHDAKSLVGNSKHLNIESSTELENLTAFSPGNERWSVPLLGHLLWPTWPAANL